MLPKVKVLKFEPREPPKRIERIWSEKCTSVEGNSLWMNHSEAAPPPRIEDKHLRLSFPQSRDRVSLETFVWDWPFIKDVAQFFSSIWEFFARLFMDDIMSVSVAAGSNNSNSSGVDRSRAAVVALNPLLAVANQTTGSCCLKWGIVFLSQKPTTSSCKQLVKTREIVLQNQTKLLILAPIARTKNYFLKM